MKSLITLLLAVTYVFAATAQDSNTVKGCISGNCKNGFGKFVYENGTYYEGNFKKGKEVGKGKGTFLGENGQKYTGEFVDGKPKGFGKIIFANGDIWEGGNTDCKILNDYGKMTYPNGSQYIGLMDEFHYKQGGGERPGIYTLSNGYSEIGVFKADIPDVVEYFDAASNRITKEMFVSQEKKEIALANESYKQQYEAKLQQYIQKNKGVVVQNINIPFKDVTDLSDMSYRTNNIDIVFSNKVADLFCIKRKEQKAGNYDITEDEITAFSINSHRRVLSDYAERLQRSDLGKDIIEEFKKKEAGMKGLELNYTDTNVMHILADLNYITAPVYHIDFVGVSENYMIFSDAHRGEKIKTNSGTYYFISRKSNLCEKIVNINTRPWDLIWNEDFTRSCLQKTNKLPENLVPEAYKFGYYSIFYLVDWETSTAKHLDDHIAQLNYLTEAIYAKNQSDAKWEASRPEREAQSRRDWKMYDEIERKINENVEKAKALDAKTPKDRHYYYNSVGNKVFVD